MLELNKKESGCDEEDQDEKVVGDNERAVAAVGVTIAEDVLLEGRRAVKPDDAVLGHARPVNRSSEHGLDARVVVILRRNFCVNFCRSNFGFDVCVVVAVVIVLTLNSFCLVCLSPESTKMIL